MSSSAAMRETPNLLAYATSKWMVRGITKMCGHGTCGVACARQHDYSSFGRYADANGPAAVGTWGAMIPLDRFGRAEKVAELALFLVSDASSRAGSLRSTEGSTDA